MKFMSLFCSLICAVAMAAPPALTVTPAAPKPGDTVTVTSSVPNVTFDVRGNVGGTLTHPNKKAIIFIMPETKDGVVVVAIVGAQAKATDVAVWASGAGSPGPGPGPQPVNPDLSKLITDLNAVWKVEPESEKPIKAKLLALYTNPPTAALEAKTWGAMFEAMEAESKKQGIYGNLNFIRPVIALMLKSRLPWAGASNDAITAEGLAKAKEAFKLAADGLAALK